MKKPTRKALPRGRMQGNRLLAHGGPWDHKSVYFPVGGTMVFRLGPWHGHYNSTGEWKDVRPS
jgi:hypothetical protein